MQIPDDILNYYRSGASLIRSIPSQELDCEFYGEEVVLRYNVEYEIPEYAPGYFMFATNGGGELIALSPIGSVVRMPFIGMGAKDAWLVAPSFAKLLELLAPCN